MVIPCLCHDDTETIVLGPPCDDGIGGVGGVGWLFKARAIFDVRVHQFE